MNIKIVNKYIINYIIAIQWFKIGKDISDIDIYRIMDNNYE